MTKSARTPVGLLATAVALVIVAAYQSLRSPSPTAQSPLLVSSEREKELGTVRCGTHQKFEYDVTAHARLAVVDVKSSCNCSITTLSRFDLAKGDSATIGVDWLVPEAMGPANVYLCVVYKELDNNSRALSLGTLVLTAKADAQPKLEE